jgi:hypothetical protein
MGSLVGGSRSGNGRVELPFQSRGASSSWTCGHSDGGVGFSETREAPLSISSISSVGREILRDAFQREYGCENGEPGARRRGSGKISGQPTGRGRSSTAKIRQTAPPMSNPAPSSSKPRFTGAPIGQVVHMSYVPFAVRLQQDCDGWTKARRKRSTPRISTRRMGRSRGQRRMS